MNSIDALSPTAHERVDRPHISQKHNYQIDPMYKEKDLRIQSLEVRGKFVEMEAKNKVNVEKHEYHNQQYKELLTKVFPLRTSFRLVKDTSARKEIAKEEFDLWNGYLEGRKSEIAEMEHKHQIKELDIDHLETLKETATHFNYKIHDHDKIKMEEFFDRFKVSLNNILHHQLTKLKSNL